MAVNLKIVLLLLLVAIGISVFVTSQNGATTDQFDYFTPPPSFVWNNVLPLIKNLQTFTRELDPPFFQIMSDISASQLPPILVALCKRDIPDLLLNGPQTVSWLAQKSGSDPHTLYRALRRVAAVGYFREHPPHTAPLTNLLEHRFENTPKSHSLARNRPNPSARYMLFHQNSDIIPVLAHFEEILEKGAENVNLGAKVHKLASGNVWELFEKDPERASIFNKAMEHLDGVGAMVPILDFDWNAHCDVVLDIGGGKGRYLGNILNNTKVSKGILFDLEGPIKEAQTEWPVTYSKEANQRIKFVAGSFFNAEDLPKSDGKSTHCYVLRVVIHDWNDANSTKILSNIAKAMAPSDLLIITENLPEDFERDPSIVFLDMVMTTIGGKERTIFQFNQLLDNSGFKPFHEVVRTRSLFKVGVTRKK